MIPGALFIARAEESLKLNRKVMIAMSGGVDSSVAAFLLREQGWDCAGVTMKLFDNEDVGIDREDSCCSVRDAEDARSAAHAIGIPHYVFNMSREFDENVIEKFVSEYSSGRTPNPCIDCNRYVKFDRRLEKARAAGYDRIATGHYARVDRSRSGRFLLRKGVDESKDQSYVLYSMTQKQLELTLFPLGGLFKREVREIARQEGLRTAAKPESQDICFVGDGDYADFIERRTGSPPRAGNFIDREGAVIGSHKGAVHYTIGQRRGLGMGFGERKFVVAKDMETNSVTLGDEDDLLVKTLYADNVNLIAADRLDEKVTMSVRTRYRQNERAAAISPAGTDIIKVEFEYPQKGVAAGQAVVFYSGDVVFGGGTVRETRTE
jgi:tRNA-specific 2-thiouridylase